MLWNLSFINQFSKKWHRLASTASNRKGAKIQHEFSWFCQKKMFSKHQNIIILFIRLLNSRSRMTLKFSVVVFQDLETSAASLTSAASATSLASTARVDTNSIYSPISSKKLPYPDWLIINGTTMTNTGHFCGMDCQKSKFSLLYGTLSVWGCWGQSMSLF